MSAFGSYVCLGKGLEEGVGMMSARESWGSEE